MANCQVCGKPSGFFPLCKDCNSLKDEGKIVKCEKCNTWHYKNKSCKCDDTQPKNKTKAADETKVDKDVLKNDKPQPKELTCIICGQNSNGMHFCLSCYHKYKDREFDLRVKNCVEFEILDEYGNLKYTCADGRKVRSKSEVIISDFLFSNKIRAIYEKEVYYKENGEDKVLHPDFYLPDYDLYIEHNGYTNSKDYNKRKEYSEKIYNQIGYKVIITSEEDLKNIAACLKPKLGLH